MKDSVSADDWFTCPNTGLPKDDCRCLDCIPIIHRFKWLVAKCENIDEVIARLEQEVLYFKFLKQEGYTIGGPISDDYMHLYPPKKEGYYWAGCKKCGHPFLVQKGAVPPRICDECDLKGDLCEA
jgi:hypothetical protein